MKYLCEDKEMQILFDVWVKSDQNFAHQIVFVKIPRQTHFRFGKFHLSTENFPDEDLTLIPWLNF